MQKKKLSALIDGELLDSELLFLLLQDRTLQQSWQGYHLIRDILRGNIEQEVIHLDIADRVAASLAKEAKVSVSSVTLEPQKKIYIWQKILCRGKAISWVNQIAQVTMAACVALVIIISVQYHNRPDRQVGVTESPAFNTLPIMGQLSQVSLGVQADNFSIGTYQQKQVQEQCKRINEMLHDYALKKHLHLEQEFE